MEIKFDEETLKQAAIDQVAESVMRDTDFSADVTARVQKLVDERVSATINERIDAALPPIIEAVFTKAYQPVSRYGEPKGPPLTLAEIIELRAVEWLQTKVSTYDGSREDYNGIPRAQFVLKQALDVTIKKNVEPIVAQLKAEVLKAVNKSLTKELMAPVLAQMADSLRKACD